MFSIKTIEDTNNKIWKKEKGKNIIKNELININNMLVNKSIILLYLFLNNFTVKIKVIINNTKARIIGSIIRNDIYILSIASEAFTSFAIKLKMIIIIPNAKNKNAGIKYIIDIINLKIAKDFNFWSKVLVFIVVFFKFWFILFSYPSTIILSYKLTFSVIILQNYIN